MGRSPAAEDMIAVCKYWYERYGANSLEAAKERYAFCTDQVDQGTRTYTISEMAAGLAYFTVWYFWWD